MPGLRKSELAGIYSRHTAYYSCAWQKMSNSNLSRLILLHVWQSLTVVALRTGPPNFPDLHNVIFG